MTKPNAPEAHKYTLLLRYYYLSKDYIMPTSPKAMLLPGFLPESLEKIQLILLILSTAFIKIESIPLIFSTFSFNQLRA